MYLLVPQPSRNWHTYLALNSLLAEIIGPVKWFNLGIEKFVKKLFRVKLRSYYSGSGGGIEEAS